MMLRGHVAAVLLAGAISAGLAMPAWAQAPLQLAPHSTHPPAKPTAKHKPATKLKARPRPMAQPKEPDPTTAHAEAAAPSGPEPDLAFGAYQRGYYLTAFAIATKRVEEKSDAKAMTLLGELYSNGFGVEHDDKKAAEWYQLAANRGDREAMFALAMFRMGGRAGEIDREGAAKLLAAAAKLGHVAASYDLGLLYLEGQLFPQDYKRAAELFRVAADAGSPEAQYALATLYKEGRGVAKDLTEAARLLAWSSRADYTDAEVEFGIALFNGTGVAKNEAAGAALLKKAAKKGSPIAQNRIAKILAFGRGMPADPVEAIKWHIIAKAAGAPDPILDDFERKQSIEVRGAAEKAAKPWLDAIKSARESRS